MPSTRTHIQVYQVQRRAMVKAAMVPLNMIIVDMNLKEVAGKKYYPVVWILRGMTTTAEVVRGYVLSSEADNLLI